MIWSCNMYKNKTMLSKKKNNRPLCFDVIAKCYKRHRFLPSATLWALSILPQWHLCLPFTRIIHRHSESERTWRRGGTWQRTGDPNVAKLSITGCELKTKRGQMYTHTHKHERVRMKCVREKERLALCSANSQIVLRRSKAECDREGLHTPFFIV